MNIIVCIKQVPDTQKVKVDEKTGVLLREGIDNKMNPFDLYAIETALGINGDGDGKIVAITMGPPSAQAVLYEALALGVDEAYLLSDRLFAGADVLSTSYTIAHGILKIEGDYDLILCGKQTTDGDTAQVGPSVAEHLGLPHLSFVNEITEIKDNSLVVKQDFQDYSLKIEVQYPCLITVEKGIYEPNLPSFKLRQKTKDYKINVLTFNDMDDQDKHHYGLSGSPTQVEEIFEPNTKVEQVIYQDSKTNAQNLYQVLKDLKVLEAN